MIVILKKSATEEEIRHIIEKVEALGMKVNLSRGVEKAVLGLIGPEDVMRVTPLEAFPGVDRVIPVLAPFRLVSREYQNENTIIQISKDVSIGGKRIPVMAGPCSIEDEQSLFLIADHVKRAGASVLRGGAFKPRTSPYDFQGLGKEGLKIMAEAGAKYGLATITEVMDPRDVELVCRYADIVQVGARNMQNFTLLNEVGASRKPVMLKRGISATVKEWLMAAEYILSNGNFDVMFCERGIRTFETMTRNTLDINAVSLIKHLSHLPVVVDPSHATGHWHLVGSAAKAGVAAGCDGLMIEVHHNPEEAFSDGPQSLLPEKMQTLMTQLGPLARAVEREI